MLTTRQEQMRVLADATFERWLQSELLERFPLDFQALGTVGATDFIGSSVARGRALGFGSNELLRFTALEFVFGGAFYEDAEWARTALATGNTAAGRLQSLVEAAVFRLAEMAESEADFMPANAPATYEADGQPMTEEDTAPAYEEPPEPDEIDFPGAEYPTAEEREYEEQGEPENE